MVPTEPINRNGRSVDARIVALVGDARRRSALAGLLLVVTCGACTVHIDNGGRTRGADVPGTDGGSGRATDAGETGESDAGLAHDAGALPAGDAGAGDVDAGEVDAGSANVSDDGVVVVARPTDLYAVSDIHGAYPRLVSLLAGNGLIAPSPASPTAVQWTGGAAVLVVVGDLIDKGPDSVEVIDALIALQASAASAGGRVVVTLGNHEAEFLADPTNSKATASDGIDPELQSDGITPATFASSSDARGMWLRSLPAAAIVGSWFFAHAGDTGGRTLAELRAAIGPALAAGDYASAELTGSTTSILESHAWADQDPSLPAQEAAALGVKHIVFGHTPTALGPAGSIALTSDGAGIRIDCGMSPTVNDSSGRLLHVHATATLDTATQLTKGATATALWSGAP